MAVPKKPRVRKTAPTVRERVEQAKIKSETPAKPGLLKPKLAAAGRPLKRLVPKLPDNRATRVLKRILGFFVPRYVVNSWREVRQVTWPTRRETWRLTLAVFIFAVVFGALVAGVDKVLDILFKNLVLK